MSSQGKQLVFKIAKFLVSIILVYLIVSWVNVPQTLGIIRNVNPWLILQCAVINFCLVFINAAKVQLIFGDKALKFLTVAKCNFLKLFSEYLLPGSVSGELVRAVSLGRATGQYPKSVSVVIMDRIMGFWVQSALAAVSIFVIVGFDKGRYTATIWSLGFFLVCIILSVLLFSFAIRAAQFVISYFLRLIKSSKEFNLDAKIMGSLLSRRWHFTAIMVLGFLYQYFIIYILLTFDDALGNTLNFYQAVLIHFLSVIAVTMPLSISGIGVLEGTLGLAFNYLGGSSETGVAISILMRITAFPTVFAGWLVFLKSGFKINDLSKSRTMP